MDTNRVLYLLANYCHNKRRERGLTQAELADLTGLHRLRLYKLEVGHTNVAFLTVCKLINVLGTEGEEFEELGKEILK